MANPWFRLYSEFEDDPKVQMMPEAMQRRLIMLMCSRCKDETLRETQRAFKWRISAEELAETKALFIENGFIDKDWNLLNWNRRQFISDSSTDRVRRYREGKKQDETLHETDETKGNVTVTAPDTEQIQIQKQRRTEETLASTALAVPASPTAFTIYLTSGKTHLVTEADVGRIQKAFPAVDVEQEFRAMVEWLDAKPDKRSHSIKGAKSRIVNWMSKKQDEGGSKNGRSGNGAQGRITGIDQSNRGALAILASMDTPAYLGGGSAEAGAGAGPLLEGTHGAVVATNPQPHR